MAEKQAAGSENPEEKETYGLSEKLDVAVWAVFFIWVGIAILANVGWGWGFLGVGVIIFGEVTLRKYFDLKIQRLWIGSGFVFVVGGLWELFQVPWPLVPVLLILYGLLALWVAFLGGHMLKK